MGRVIMNTTLIKQRFSRSLQTYEQTAIVQREMAKILTEFLPQNKNFDSILEIGCGTGFLTRELVKKINYTTYTANDIVEDCSKYIESIDKNIVFLKGDINSLTLNSKYDLIISNAVFQWFKGTDFLHKLKQHLKPDGIIVFSSFGEKNFQELKEIFNIGLEYSQFAKPTFENIIELEFETLVELLKHIQSTGVNAITNYPLTKGALKQLEKEFLQKYGKIKLTYNPTYFII